MKIITLDQLNELNVVARLLDEMSGSGHVDRPTEQLAFSSLYEAFNQERDANGSIVGQARRRKRNTKSLSWLSDILTHAAK